VVADASACAASVEVYEQLRRHAVDGDGQGWRLGLALLHRRGMAGWMRAWDGLPTPSRAARCVPPVPVTPGDQPLVALLASMALACVAGR
jgi:hypothetical protein